MDMRATAFAILVPFAVGVGCVTAAPTIPFELCDNMVLVPVRVNGSGPYSFLLDTGASTSFLNQTLADTLGVGTRGQHDTKVGAGESSTKLGFAKDVVFSLPGVDLPAQNVAVVPLAGIEAAIGHKVGGIVGADLFKRYVVTIDYAGRIVTLEDPKTFAYSGKSEGIAIRLSGGRAFFKATVTPAGGAPIAAEFILDSGDDSTLTFHTPFVEKHHLRAAGQKLVAHVSTGLSGESRNWRGRISSFACGGFVIDRPVATFSEARRGSEADGSYDGVLGGEILRRFRVTVDYSRRQMILEPNSAFADPYEFDMSGAALAGHGPDFKTIAVERVSGGSAAADAGLMPGDTIEGVDDSSAETLGLDRVRQMFRQDGSQHSLAVRRGTQLVNVTLTIHRLT
jgi:hypothetical protein